MPEYANPLGDTIRQARVSHGFSQRGLAEQLAIDSRTILNIENYNGNPKAGRVSFPADTNSAERVQR